MTLRVTAPPAETPEALDVTATATLLGSSDITAVQSLIQGVTDLAEQIVGRPLWYRGYEEIQSADGTDRLYLRARPIAEVTLVQRGDETALVEGTDADEYQVWTTQGFLESECKWAEGRPHWTVQYTGGYWLPSMPTGTLPTGAVTLAEGAPRLQQALSSMVELSFQIQSGDRRIKTARLSSMSVTYELGKPVPEDALLVLNSLKRPAF